jgi:hypothetical protein
MAKNIVILSDGTGQGASMPKAERTNVWKLWDATKKADPAQQVTFYDEGLRAEHKREWWRWAYDLASRGRIPSTSFIASMLLWMRPGWESASALCIILRKQEFLASFGQLARILTQLLVAKRLVGRFRWQVPLNVSVSFRISHPCSGAVPSCNSVSAQHVAK